MICFQGYCSYICSSILCTHGRRGILVLFYVYIPVTVSFLLATSSCSLLYLFSVLSHQYMCSLVFFCPYLFARCQYGGVGPNIDSQETSIFWKP